MEQVRQGSQEAAEQVWREYGPYVVYVVRRSLHESMRSRLDSQDFAQDVWASFFRELPGADEVQTPDALLQVLTKMARNKVVEEYRRQHTQRRNIDNDVPSGLFLDEDELIDEREPTPSQLLAAEFMVHELTADQPPEFGRMVRLRREGLSDVEIAEREQISTRTVRRVFDSLKRAFRKRWGDGHE
jgi:RNA polymerase sigma factor (sigma-70 family)